jgi:hypothetical protein
VGTVYHFAACSRRRAGLSHFLELMAGKLPAPSSNAHAGGLAQATNLRASHSLVLRLAELGVMAGAGVRSAPAMLAALAGVVQERKRATDNNDCGAKRD